MRKLCLLSLLGLFLMLLAGCTADPESAGDTHSPGFDAEWQLIWADEFNYVGLPDSTKWSYDVGGHGWGNKEHQYYRNGNETNSSVDGQHLTITVRKEDYQDSRYTSARLVTKEKGDWLYGKIEARAKLPTGRGTWPAIWMLPTDWEYGGWPASGEIDIMEHVGYDPGIVHGTVHTEAYNHTLGTHVGDKRPVENFDSEFHVYSVEWSADTIKTAIDGEYYFTFVNEESGSETWPFDKRFHLIMNIAVGGSWGGLKGIDDTIFPQSMVVDYVRVYERNN